MTLDIEWVPASCRLYLWYDGTERLWHGALRRRDDFLGYVVHDVACVTAEQTIDFVRKQYLKGLNRLADSLSGRHVADG